MDAVITTDGKRVIATIPYANGSGPRLAKKVPGAKAIWNRATEPGQRDEFVGWGYPLSMDTCRSFRKVFGDDLHVLPPLVRWAHEQVAVERKIEDAREDIVNEATFALLADEAPDLLAAMRNRQYQLAGASAILAAKNFILGDDPGLGKTLQTLAALIESGSKTILVGCRKSAMRTVWERETLRWTPGIATFVAQGSRAEREAVMEEFDNFPTTLPGIRKMLIINIEMVRAKRVEVCPDARTPLGACPYDAWTKPRDHKHRYEFDATWPQLFAQQWDAIVLDESHNLLASTANYQSKRITQQRYGAVMLQMRCLAEGGITLALSGTPFRSKLEKAWGTLNWVQPKQFGSYWKWAGTHFGVEDGRYGKIVGGGKKVLEPLDEEAWDRMLRPHYLKRTKAVAAPDLPPIMYAGTPMDRNPEGGNYVQLEMDGEQERIYREWEADAEAELEGRRITATGTLPEITRLRQAANASGRVGDGRTVLPALPSNKLEWLVEFMQEREGTGAKVVVASSFTAIVELAAAVLRKEGFEVLTLTGATSDRDRSDLVARFQDPADSLQVVCLNRIAGGESITLDAADEMVVIDQPWISDQDEQLTARIHRVSRIHQVIIYRLVSIGTIDEWMASLTAEQREVVAKASPRKLSEMLKEAREERIAA
jgi:SNF2 family DNA or RNA helicase